MTDFIQEYQNRVRKKLSRAESEPVSRMAEALCFPAFHAETLLRVTEGIQCTTCRLITLSSSLWYSDESESPTRLQESTVVSPDRALQFWELIENLKPETIRPEGSFGCDGMSVFVTFQRREMTSSFETWSPEPMSPPGKLVGLIYGLAREVMNVRSSIERLEQLHTYLNIGLPARIIEGNVRCLRIFGSLSVNHEELLRNLFDSLRDTDALVVDMTNFDGMGTRLYPLFSAFASTRPLLAWAASGHARRHIESMGLTEPMIFSTTDEAIDWISRRR